MLHQLINRMVVVQSILILIVCCPLTSASAAVNGLTWQVATTPAPRHWALPPASSSDFLPLFRVFIKTGDRTQIPKLLQAYQRSRLPKQSPRIIFTLYDHAGRRHRFIAAHAMDNSGLTRLLHAVADHVVHHPIQLRAIQVDYVVGPYQTFDFMHATGYRLANRFEVGVDGLLVKTPQSRHFFLPSDFYVGAIGSLAAFKRTLVQTYGPEYQTFRFNTFSLMAMSDQWIAMYRGHPQLVYPLSSTDRDDMAREVLNKIVREQRTNGQFSYYYEASNNSTRDHEHPRLLHPYYNIVRHNAAILMLLDAADYYHDVRYRYAGRRALAYLIRQLGYYQDGKAAYVNYNHKAKLGASGIALAAFSRYLSQEKNDTFTQAAHALARHLQNSIMPNGEFQYYYRYLDKSYPIQDNPKYFNFYYPGEALLGLTDYYAHLATPRQRRSLKHKITKAFHYLFVKRPQDYASHFKSLPSDSWLMQAAVNWWHQEGDRHRLAQFVFEQAEQLVAQRYVGPHHLYRDYYGAFFYDFGDHAYPDPARGEGLVAALKLAHAAGNKQKAEKYQRACQQLAWNVAQLYNSSISTYGVPAPERAQAGVRFKLTRQWFRIDTMQHFVSFYLGLATA